MNAKSQQLSAHEMRGSVMETNHRNDEMSAAKVSDRKEVAHQMVGPCKTPNRLAQYCVLRNAQDRTI